MLDVSCEQMLIANKWAAALLKRKWASGAQYVKCSSTVGLKRRGKGRETHAEDLGAEMG